MDAGAGRRVRILNILVIAAALLLGLWFLRTLDVKAVEFSLEERVAHLEAGREFSVDVPLDEVSDILLVRDPDFGVPLEDGGLNSRCRYGRWHNEEWGNYIVAAEQKLHSCVVLIVDREKESDGAGSYAGERFVVFSCESDDATEDLWRALRESIGLSVSEGD